jgi:hypothetical protein|tara:strand:- start:74 stop:1105 length:1032 start_codon:yes stop_codon:yes gene_type:complete
MRLRDILKESEDRGLTSEVKKHFLEIVSTYNKYQESMDRKSDIIEVAETLGGITEAARELALREADDWFDKHTIKRNMNELNKLGSQFDKVAKEARNLDQRLNGLYEDMGNILSRYYKIGEISEDEMKQRLGIKEGKGDCGCGCGGVTEGGCGDKSSKLNDIKNEVLELDKDEMAKLHNDGEIEKDGEKIVFKNEDVDNEELLSALKDKLSDEGGAAGFKDLQDKAKEMGVDLTADMLKGMDGISQHRDGDYILDGFASDAQRRAAFASGYKAKGKKGKKKNELKVFGEKVTKLIEKNVPTNPSKWAYYKAQAKKKFDVYPSAYANGWAARKYKAAGGGWKKG